jgi:cell division septation protein DedD
MRPIRTLAPLALGLMVLAVAGCQRPSDPTTTAAPTPTTIEGTISTTPTRHPTPSPTPAPTSTPDPGSETIVGLWPVKTLAQARELQDSVDAGHQPWRLSAESVALAYAQGELRLFGPYAQQVGAGAYQVRSHHGEWAATLYLAQPVRHDNGIWVVTRVGDPVSEL